MTKKKGTAGKVVRTLLILAAIAAAGGYMYSRKAEEPKDGSSSQASAMLQTHDSTAEVTVGSIDRTVEGNGSIEAASTVTVTAEDALLVSSVTAEKGDVLEAGDEIAKLDEDSIDDLIDAKQQELNERNTSIAQSGKDGSDYISAPVSGRVKRIFAKEGDLLKDVVANYGGIVEIAAGGTLKVSFTSDKKVRLGEEVTVSFLNVDADALITDVKDGVYTATFDDKSSYQVDQEATVKDEDDQVLGTGKVLSAHPYLVDAQYGVADEIRVEVNDYVDSGNTILTRTESAYNADYLDMLDQRDELMQKLQDLRALREDPTIRAEQDGILSDLMLADKTVTAENSPMYTLISTDSYDLKAEIDELDIAGVKAGQTAQIVFDALDEQTFEGTVRKVSALGNNVNGVTTYTVTIELPGTEELKTSMSATATIVTDHRDDVLLIPVDAIQTNDGQKYVTVVNGEETEDVNVTLGLVNNTMAEVTEGLTEGQTVVVIGTSDMEEMMNMMRSGRNANSSSAGGGN